MTKAPRSKDALQKSTSPSKREDDAKSRALGSISPTHISSADRREVAPPKIMKADSYSTIYANYTKVGISQWDMTIVFGQTVDSENDEANIEELISVKFSPQYFKAMANSLIVALNQWENIFGDLQDGPGQKPNIQGIEESFTRLKDKISEMEQLRKK